MLSVLIPTYNFNAFSLARVIEQQLLKANIKFEIICIDDGSKSIENLKNENINTLINGLFIANSVNVGRIQNRQNLALKAKYDNLLFLDSDTLPTSSKYISNYLKAIKKHPNTTLFGGFAYKNESYSHETSLRYTFGKNREEVLASQRNKLPYKTIISANFCIPKKLFFELNTIETTNLYGLDYLFGALLKEKQAKVLHIDNSVYHFGLDNNQEFLKKSLEAVETLSYISKKHKMKLHEISLLRFYNFLKSIHLHNLTKLCLGLIKKIMEKNLLSKRPNLILFDLYRLHHFLEVH